MFVLLYRPHISHEILSLCPMQFSHCQTQQPRHCAYDNKYKDPDRVSPCQEKIPVVRIRPLPYAVDQIVSQIDDSIHYRRQHNQSVLSARIREV